jgi:hypothetical protein
MGKIDFLASNRSDHMNEIESALAADIRKADEVIGEKRKISSLGSYGLTATSAEIAVSGCCKKRRQAPSTRLATALLQSEGVRHQ